MVLAERIKGDRSLDHLADLAVGAAPALRRKRRDELGVALVTLGRVEECVEKPSRGPGGSRRVERHPEGLEDLGGVSLESPPLVIGDSAGPGPLPVPGFDTLRT